ncbi:MAG: ABC transporter substrate-binding protein [Desulfobacteraceae bacterium]|nr:MAG: ABC transporter substrate-binding protein [Desulfobacteraceae bacterium]
MRNFRCQIKKFVIASFVMLISVTAGSASADQTIKIGVIGPMRYITGEHIWTACSIAAEEINKSGGIAIKGKRYNIELAKADSNEFSSLSDAISAMERLITENKVDFLIGIQFSEAALALQEVMADYKKIWLSPGSSHEEQCLRVAKNYDRYKYFFRCGPPNTIFAGRIAAHELMMTIEKVREELGIEKPKVALFRQTGLWAEANMKNSLKDVPKSEFTTVGEWVVSITASDVTAEMSAIKAARPHIIFSMVSGPVGITMSKAWGELKIPATLIGANIAGMSSPHWQATNGMCDYEATMNGIGRVEITEKTIPFYDKVLERTKQNPLYATVDSYDAVYVIKDAVERAGTLETDAVIAALEKTDYRGAMGRISFYPKGHKWPHDLKCGPGYVTWVATQWRDGNAGRKGL